MTRKQSIVKYLSLKLELSRVDPWIVQCIFSNNAIVYLHMRNIKCQILTLNTFKGLIKRIITKSMKYAFDGVARYFIPNRLSFLTMIKSNCGNGPCPFLLKLREHRNKLKPWRHILIVSFFSWKDTWKSEVVSLFPIENKSL